MKVISFKVDDEVYFALREKNVSFRSIFEPIAIEKAQNNRRGMVYSAYTQRNDSDLYIYLSKIKDDIEKLLKKHEKEVEK